MKSQKTTTVWVIVIILLVAGIFYFVFANNPTKNPDVTIPDTTNNGQTPETPNTNPPEASKMITVTSPKEGDTVNASAGFSVAGKAVGGWFFEASAPVRIYSKNGTLLQGTYITAQGEWMTSNFVDFKGQIQPFLTNGATEGYILFENDNPSDNEGFHREFKVNVKFAAQETQTIKLYFGNTIKNPNSIDCSKVYVVERKVPKTASIATLALRTLLQGTTEAEAALGYTSAFDRGTGNELKSLSVTNGVAKADFSVLPSAGSCLVGEARAQIEQTLKQFSTIKTVKILLNGSESEALQP